VKRYQFQAMITFDPPVPDHRAALPSGQTRRMTVRGEHHQTHATKFFSAMVADTGESMPGQPDDHAIVSVSIPSPDAPDYFGVGAPFALWLDGDVAHGVVTRRGFVWPLTA
jgi:hypothetical protein